MAPGHWEGLGFRGKGFIGLGFRDLGLWFEAEGLGLCLVRACLLQSCGLDSRAT